MMIVANGPAQSSGLDGGCVVSVLNRSARVEADGSWVLPNVPANLGQVRVRATCVENGIVTFGASGLITVPANGVIKVNAIDFQGPPPVPSSLSLSAPATSLSAVGQTVQISATATYPGGSTDDVTAETTGTDYRTSNPAIATVDANGLVTARASGVALISASNEGALGVIRIQIVASGDSDGDGLPDDFEIAHGLDPNNPLDVLDDQDKDGLTTLEEFRAGLDPFNPDTDGDGLLDGREVNELHTNPLLADTDGDGFRDGLEVSTGSDPLDPNSFNLAAALQSIEVSPTVFTLVFNTALGEASRQLQVTGHLIDGYSLNITKRYGTTYASSNLAIANFGTDDGRVYAGQDGTATITALNNGHTATSQATVRSFAPTPLGSVLIPGSPRAVALQANYAYVASVESGRGRLYVVDVSNPAVPTIVGSVEVGGAKDVAVEGNFAYVISENFGLVVVDVSNPASPALVTTHFVSGAERLVSQGQTLYVSTHAGLSVLDVTVPSSPADLGSLLLPAGGAFGLDVKGSIAALARGSKGLFFVDISDPRNPTLLGSTPTRTNGTSSAAAVAIRDSKAYVADGANWTLGGLRVVDFTEPSNPVVIGSSSDAFGLVGVALDGDLALTADYYFVNAVPIFKLGESNPSFSAALNFPGDPNGTDVKARNGFVYLLADSWLFIGRYLDLTDDLGIPPSVEITLPAEGSSARERTFLTVEAQASDDIAVWSVEFFVNGQSVGKDYSRPFSAVVEVPVGSTTLVLGAKATDLGGNETLAEERTVSVIPDSSPVVRLLAPVEGSQFVEGSTITLAATASDDLQVTSVEFDVNGALLLRLTSPPYRATYAIPLGGPRELVITAVASDNVGQSSPATATVQVVADQPPTAAVVQPTEGSTFVAGSLLQMIVGATDDVGVTRVVFLVDGAPVGEADTAPYIFDMVVPATASELRLAAEATDTLGRTTRSPEVRVSIVSNDPLTTATGTVVDPQGAVVAGASVTCAAVTGTTLANGTFSIPGVPTALGPIRCRASFRDAQGRDYAGTSQRVAPVPSGVTPMGQIQIQPAGVFLYPGPQLTVEAEAVKIADLNGDQIPDLIAAASSDGAAVFLGKPGGGYEPVRYFETAGSPRDVLIGDFNGDSIPDIATANGGSDGVSVLLGNGDGTFQPHIDSPTSGALALAAGDFNEDGLLDLAVAGGNTLILLGNGDGTLSLAATLATVGTVFVEVGDINQDGHLDLVSAQSRSSASDVQTFLGNGHGAFTLNRSVSLGFNNPVDLAVGDLNHDGRLDFAIVSGFGNTINVFFALADGSYTAGPILRAGRDPEAVIASDIDGDGNLDLAAVDHELNDVYLFLGNGSGSFSSGTMAFTGATPGDLTAGDLNGDGIPDLVTVDTLGLSLLFGLGNAVFDTDRRYPAGENPQGVAVGDFNGDGAQDLAVASNDSAEVAILLGRGDGTFAPEHRFPAGADPVAIVAADFDGDGKLDLATSNDDSVNVLLGHGDGTFASPSAFPAGDHPMALRARDLNGDGHLDLVTANTYSDDISVLLGRGDGTFAPQVRYPVGGSPVDLTVGDFQGDGHPDLVTANNRTNDLSLLSGNGDGSFGPEVRIALSTASSPPPVSVAAGLQKTASTPYPFPQSVAAADLDGDGKEDLATSYFYDSSTGGEFHGVLLGNGDGTFKPLMVTPTGPNAFGLMIVADANGDGIPDLVHTSPGGGATQDIVIVLGQGDGTFGAPQRYDVGCAPYYLAAGDFNGDGQTDFATTTFGCHDTYDVAILIHH
jgi:hypothetical protein